MQILAELGESWRVRKEFESSLIWLSYAPPLPFNTQANCSAQGDITAEHQGHAGNQAIQLCWEFGCHPPGKSK